MELVLPLAAVEHIQKHEPKLSKNIMVEAVQDFLVCKKIVTQMIARVKQKVCEIKQWPKVAIFIIAIICLVKTYVQRDLLKYVLDYFVNPKLIPSIPTNGCPSGTYSYNGNTCCYGNGCCWSKCSWANVPENSFGSSINAYWMKDACTGWWIAQETGKVI